MNLGVSGMKSVLPTQIARFRSEMLRFEISWNIESARNRPRLWPLPGSKVDVDSFTLCRYLFHCSFLLDFFFVRPTMRFFAFGVTLVGVIAGGWDGLCKTAIDLSAFFAPLSFDAPTSFFPLTHTHTLYLLPRYAYVGVQVAYMSRSTWG